MHTYTQTCMVTLAQHWNICFCIHTYIHTYTHIHIYTHSCGDSSTALEFFEIQRLIIGGDVCGLIRFLESTCEVSRDLKRQSFYAHLVVFFKILTYMHGGMLVQVICCVCMHACMHVCMYASNANPSMRIWSCFLRF